MRSRRRRIALLGVSIALLVLPAPARAGPEAGRPAPRTVRLETADGLKLAATFWSAGEKGGPGVVLLPMYKSDYQAWASVVRPLRDRGVAVLALDPRGHGRSRLQGTRDLGTRVAARDKALFGAMHQDAIAAVRWLAGEGACDAKRIVLVGASVGFAVAVDTARRHPKEIAAIAGLSPVLRTLGIDAGAKLKGVPADRPMLLMVHREEIDLGAKQIVEGRPATRLVVYEEARPAAAGRERGWAHGTRMLDRLPLTARTIASFVAVATGSKTENVVLDGIVTDEGANADPWSEATEVGIPDGPGTVRAFRVGRRLLFGGTVKPNVGGLQLEVQTGASSEGSEGEISIGPPQVVGVDLEDGSVAWSWGGMASVPTFPGLDTSHMFGKTLPVIRAVRTDQGTAFEGEWFIPEFGDSSDAIRLVVAFARTAPPRPSGGMVYSNTQHAVDLPSR